jgi:hypothetical protein
VKRLLVLDWDLPRRFEPPPDVEVQPAYQWLLSPLGDD